MPAIIVPQASDTSAADVVGPAVASCFYQVISALDHCMSEAASISSSRSPTSGRLAA